MVPGSQRFFWAVGGLLGCSAQALFLEVAALYVVDMLELAVLSVLSSAEMTYDLRYPRPNTEL